MKNDRRDFIKKSAVAGAVLASSTSAIFATEPQNPNIKCKGWAMFDESGEIKQWKFERRPVGEHDILIEVKAASICHSDIHTGLGHWGKQIFPQVPGHEIVGIVAQVGSKVTKFKVGDRAGVGCMCDSKDISAIQEDREHYDSNTYYTYGQPFDKEPTGITQGGYSDYVVVRDQFAVHIPENIDFEHAAPLMCAGITTYSPLMKYKIKKGMKVGVAGIGGLGHMAVKLAVSLGAEVTAFTTTADKKTDIEKMGAKAVVVTDPAKDLASLKASFDYVLSTIPYEHEIMPYVLCVKPYGTFTIVGMPINFEHKLNLLALADSDVQFSASKIGGMKETQKVVDYCAKNRILPQIELIEAKQITQAWKDVVAKKARFRYVIDPKTI